MLLFIQLMVSGFLVGGLYAIIALGFVLIFKATRILNFAQGEFVMLGGYLSLVFVEALNLPLWISFILIPIVVAIVAFFIQHLSIRAMIGESIISIVMVTIGVAIIMRALTQMIWGAENMAFPANLPDITLEMGGIIFLSDYLWAFMVSIACVIIFTLFFKYSKIGLAMRAVSESQEISLAMGTNVQKVFAISWLISCGIAGIGGLIIANMSGISLSISDVALKVFAVIILGGLDSILGAIIGGFIIGILENLAGGYLDPILQNIKDVFPYLIIIIVLMFRPYGLFGTEEIERL